MGTKAHGFHSVAPRCVRATRWGRTSVTQGDLVSSEGKVWLEKWDTRRRKGAKPGTQSPTRTRSGVGADISASEIPADAVPGVGSGRGTLERDQNKRSRIATIERQRRLAPKDQPEGEGPVLCGGVR